MKTLKHLLFLLTHLILFNGCTAYTSEPLKKPLINEYCIVEQPEPSTIKTTFSLLHGFTTPYKSKTDPQNTQWISHHIRGGFLAYEKALEDETRSPGVIQDFYLKNKPHENPRFESQKIIAENLLLGKKIDTKTKHKKTPSIKQLFNLFTESTRNARTELAELLQPKTLNPEQRKQCMTCIQKITQQFLVFFENAALSATCKRSIDKTYDIKKIAGDEEIYNFFIKTGKPILEKNIEDNDFGWTIAVNPLGPILLLSAISNNIFPFPSPLFTTPNNLGRAHFDLQASTFSPQSLLPSTKLGWAWGISKLTAKYLWASTGKINGLESKYPKLGNLIDKVNRWVYKQTVQKIFSSKIKTSFHKKLLKSLIIKKLSIEKIKNLLKEKNKKLSDQLKILLIDIPQKKTDQISPLTEKEKKEFEMLTNQILDLLVPEPELKNTLITPSQSLNLWEDLVTLFRTKDPIELPDPILNMIVFFIGGQELTTANSQDIIIINESILNSIKTTFTNLDQIITKINNKLDASETLFDKIQTKTAIGKIKKTESVLYQKNKLQERAISLSILQKSSNEKINTLKKQLIKIAELEEHCIPGFAKKPYTRERLSQATWPQIFENGTIGGVFTGFVNKITRLPINILKKYVNNTIKTSPITASTKKTIENIEAKHPWLKKVTTKISPIAASTKKTIENVKESIENITDPAFDWLDAKYPEQAEKGNSSLFWGLRVIPLSLILPIAYTAYKEGSKLWATNPSISAFTYSTATKLPISILNLDVINSLLTHTFAPLSFKPNSFSTKIIKSTPKAKTYQIIQDRYATPSADDRLTSIMLWTRKLLFSNSISTTQTPLTNTYSYTAGNHYAPTKFMCSLPKNISKTGIAAMALLGYGAITCLDLRVPWFAGEGQGIWKKNQEKMISEIHFDLTKTAEMTLIAKKLCKEIDELKSEYLQKIANEIKEIIFNDPFFNLHEKIPNRIDAITETQKFDMIRLKAQIKKQLPKLMQLIGDIDLHIAIHTFLQDHSSSCFITDFIEEFSTSKTKILLPDAMATCDQKNATAQKVSFNFSDKKDLEKLTPEQKNIIIQNISSALAFGITHTSTRAKIRHKTAEKLLATIQS